MACVPALGLPLSVHSRPQRLARRSSLAELQALLLSLDTR